MPSQPLVSIILPTFNRAHTLERAVDSVQRQSYSRWELLIEDDGSTDNTRALLHEVYGRDSRISYAYHPNIGPGASRGIGTKRARGEFITFLDSDDEYLPDHLKVRIDHMKSHPEIDFIHGGIQIVGDQNRFLVVDAEDPDRLIDIRECVVGATFFFRRKVLGLIPYWPSGYAEDFQLLQSVHHLCSVHAVAFETYVYHRNTPYSRCDSALRRFNSRSRHQ